MLKKSFILFIGMFSFIAFASTTSVDENCIVESEEMLREVAAFPVYCDGEYGGDADTIEEALAICGL
ncbi:hypothetical protein ACSTS3_05415 [Aquimarina muelleri]|uniref:hypothetical protein n=1 Tax=Aquimarina muelleri TaxID=279356 RepID=UPI003F682D45